MFKLSLFHFLKAPCSFNHNVLCCFGYKKIFVNSLAIGLNKLQFMHYIGVCLIAFQSVLNQDPIETTFLTIDWDSSGLVWLILDCVMPSGIAINHFLVNHNHLWATLRSCSFVFLIDQCG